MFFIFSFSSPNTDYPPQFSVALGREKNKKSRIYLNSFILSNHHPTNYKIHSHLIIIMANTSDKRIYGQNQRILYCLRIGFLLVNTVYLGLGSLHRSLLQNLPLYLISNLIAGWSWYQLNSMAKAVFDERGKLVSPGLDINAKGLSEYLWDIIYVTWFVHSTVFIFSTKLWWCLIVVS